MSVDIVDRQKKKKHERKFTKKKKKREIEFIKNVLGPLMTTY